MQDRILDRITNISYVIGMNESLRERSQVAKTDSMYWQIYGGLKSLNDELYSKIGHVLQTAVTQPTQLPREVKRALTTSPRAWSEFKTQQKK